MLVSGFPSPAAFGSDEAVCGVADFTPGAIAYGIAGKEWAIEGGELDPNPNRLFALREFARDEKFVVAKSAIGGLLSGEHQCDPPSFVREPEDSSYWLFPSDSRFIRCT